MPYPMLTDTLHHPAIRTPTKRPTAHMMLAWIMDNTPLTDALSIGMRVNQATRPYRDPKKGFGDVVNLEISHGDDPSLASE